MNVEYIDIHFTRRAGGIDWWVSSGEYPVRLCAKHVDKWVHSPDKEKMLLRISRTPSAGALVLDFDTPRLITPDGAFHPVPSDTLPTIEKVSIKLETFTFYISLL